MIASVYSLHRLDSGAGGALEGSGHGEGSKSSRPTGTEVSSLKGLYHALVRVSFQRSAASSSAPPTMRTLFLAGPRVISTLMSMRSSTESGSRLAGSAVNSATSCSPSAPLKVTV